MKRITALFFVFIMIVFMALPVQASTPNYTITVKFVSVSLVYNNHVGNEWTKSVLFNGKTLSIGGSTKEVISGSGKLSFTCKAVEKDKYPDIGTVAVTANISALKNGTTTYTKNVIVVENKGRYKGSKACWKFVVNVTKVKK